MSATYFTVIGNVCKVITVIINVVIWDKHATREGLCWLFMCLVAAAFYQQSPVRQPHEPEAQALVSAADKATSAEEEDEDEEDEEN